MKVGDKVQVEEKGIWYPSVVLKVDGEKCFIHYDGYSDEYDTWVGPDRIREAVPFVGLTMRQGGSVWAVLDDDGTLRINGSIVGSFEAGGGTVRRGGSIAGKVEPDGTIRVGGSLSGEIEDSGTLRRGGSIIGEIAGDGTIRKDGSIWGEVESGCADFGAKRAAAMVLAFFASDFGYEG